MGYYDRNIPIPETRQPGVIHHAWLGSMESNVFTLIGNRMKGRRACWSEAGANNLALLLCQRHTVGFESLFADLPAIPTVKPDSLETKPIWGADKIPKQEGCGYELPYRLTTEKTSSWLRLFLRDISKSNNF